MNNKSAVIYFSRTNNTSRIAEIIAAETGSDIYKIEPKIAYTDEDINWHDDNSRANLEQRDASARPEIAALANIDAYDTIYLGYPLWWGTCPKLINTLIETGIFQGKKIHAFCTSGSSGIGTSVSMLEEYGLEVGGSQRFGASSSKDEVVAWLESL